MTDTTHTPEGADDLAALAALTSGAGMWSSTELPGEIRELTLSDGPHGLRRQPQAGGDNLGIGGSLPATCFPTAVALGSTWNEPLMREVGAALGTEARAQGVDVLLGPGLNIKRSPLGGRNFEYLSEDPCISGRLAGAMVDGIQSRGVAATPKHFAVNNQETDRMRIDARVDEITLRELYLRGFEHLVRNHAPWAFMCSYNKINGVYASQDHWLLTELLRDEWGFDGLVMSDWGAVADRVAAVAAGLDLEMPPSGTDEEVVAAVREGRLDPAVLDTVRARLAQLADRTTPREGHPTEIDVEAGEALARRAAADGMVLLTNSGVLPLAATPGRVVLVGDLAVTPRYQGDGSSRVVPTRVTAPLDALTSRLGIESVTAVPGFPSTSGPDAPDADTLLQEALDAAGDADVAIVFLGQPDGVESEGFDRSSIDLPADQIAALAALRRTGIPIVAVVSGGGIVALDEVRDLADAVLCQWLGGQAVGAALTDVLLGDAEPGGRLAESIPHRLADNPSFLTFPGHDQIALYGEGGYVGYRYYDALDRSVSFPFGFGLGYTSFAWTDTAISVVDTLTWRVEVTVTNTGQRRGSDVVQVYVRRPQHSQPPVHELRGFAKVTLDPGASQRVAITVEASDLARWNAVEHQWVVDPGTYAVEVAASSRDIRATLTVTTEGDGHVSPLTEWNTVAEWAAHPRGRVLVDRVRAGIPATLAEQSSELIQMFLQLPMIKLTTWNMGLTREVLAEFTDAAAEASPS
ncbi:MAG TPA: glycoside hydrolase family 3 C-terminal domain-containing protein [Propioniciclava sp.]|jgi:beta-glucosidase|uniref:glycoside hydrolase family 3 C-terminal domain-containing protein n=1 Tax=Propioniciclava sp. TaxID=2038686 RepID=UPI002CA16637|nr:glycoside hydrolase family 3 C-terminal domain-containing protein [Propioniciclava sp.]HRL47981.1 glycoside hydrolase family 3 C-terminal domain-containing protein [Propioniciclava sp.]HRL79820.1 glycoside hydrolase family 3 C-terminal domain-containing protein [Propioniciclava sp.]